MMKTLRNENGLQSGNFENATFENDRHLCVNAKNFVRLSFQSALSVLSAISIKIN